MLFASPWQKMSFLKAALAVLLFVYIGFAFLGAAGSMNNQTGNCPFMPGHSVAFCQANPLEHIQELQSMFNTVPANPLSLLALLFSLVVIGVFLKSFFNLSPIVFFRIGVYPPSTLRSVLQEAYSRGVLNSRAF